MPPTNDVLLEKINNIIDIVVRVEEHAKETNGNVKLNSDHRIKQQTHNRWVYGLLVSLILPTGFLLIKLFI